MKRVLIALTTTIVFCGAYIPEFSVSENNFEILNKAKIESLESDDSFYNEFLDYQLSKNFGTYYTETLKSNKDLQEYSKQYLKENYGLSLGIPVYFKKLSDNTLGRYNYYNNDSIITPSEIEININHKDVHSIEKTLIHELNHYALSVLELNFKDNESHFELVNFLMYGKSNVSNEYIPMVSKLNDSCCD